MNQGVSSAPIIVICAIVTAALIFGAGFYLGLRSQEAVTSQILTAEPPSLILPTVPASTSTSVLTPIAISFISPHAGETVPGSSNVKIIVAASSTYGISSVALYVIDENEFGARNAPELIGIATSSPYVFEWTRGRFNGRHILRAVATGAPSSSIEEFSTVININVTGGTMPISPPSYNCNGGPCLE